MASETNKGRTRATKGLFGWVKRLVGSRRGLINLSGKIRFKIIVINLQVYLYLEGEQMVSRLVTCRERVKPYWDRRPFPDRKMEDGR